MLKDTGSIFKNQSYFCVSTAQSKHEIEKIISFITVTKTIKHLGVSF